MSKADQKAGGGTPSSHAPVEWFRKGLRQRANEIEFLARHVFPHPARAWTPAAAASGDVKATQVIKATLFAEEQKAWQFFVTRPFTVIGRTLMGGLQSDRTLLSIRDPLRVSLCTRDGDEIETDVIVRGDGEFQLTVELDQDIANEWLASSGRWRDSPDSIPFGLILRPVEEGGNRN
jgi:hypothetical protein